MNCVLLSKTTGLELESYDMHSASLLDATIGDNYATSPMAVVPPAEYLYDEEALHTSFEQAISGRVSALQGRLSRISASQPVAGRSFNTDPMIHAAATSFVKKAWYVKITSEPLPMDAASAHTYHVSLPRSLQQHYTMWVALALTCAMLGFDLMGLLVLHMR